MGQAAAAMYTDSEYRGKGVGGAIRVKGLPAGTPHVIRWVGYSAPQSDAGAPARQFLLHTGNEEKYEWVMPK